MPAARTDIDREAVAASVAMNGIRATARAMELPVATVQDIAKAGKVVVPTPPRASVQIRTEGAPARLQPAHVIISDELARLGAKSKLAVAKYGARVLPHAARTAKVSPDLALAMAGDVKSVVSSLQSANVPGFERETDTKAGTVVNIALLGVAPEATMQEASVIEIESEPA